LAAGSYPVTVQDANNCTFTLTAMVAESPAITATVMVTDVACNGDENGALSIMGTGGSEALSYAIDGTNFQSEGTFTGLAPGDYTITVKDGNECTFTTTATINEPAAITASIATTDLACHGDGSGAIAITAMGGTGVLSYAIDDSNFQTESTFTGLSAGSYVVTVKDEAGCEWKESATRTEPDELSVEAILVDDNTIQATAMGGTAPYEYSLDGTNYQSSSTFSRLSNGDYTVQVRDSQGCIATVSTNLTVTSTEPALGLSTIKLYPNPTDGAALITGLKLGDELRIKNMAGQQIRLIRVQNTDGHVALDVSTYPEGLYLVFITDQSGTYRDVTKLKVIH